MIYELFDLHLSFPVISYGKQRLLSTVTFYLPNSGIDSFAELL